MLAHACLCACTCVFVRGYVCLIGERYTFYVFMYLHLYCNIHMHLMRRGQFNSAPIDILYAATVELSFENLYYYSCAPNVLQSVAVWCWVVLQCAAADILRLHGDRQFTVHCD